MGKGTFHWTRLLQAPSNITNPFLLWSSSLCFFHLFPTALLPALLDLIPDTHVKSRKTITTYHRLSPDPQVSVCAGTVLSPLGHNRGLLVPEQKSMMAAPQYVLPVYTGPLLRCSLQKSDIPRNPGHNFSHPKVCFWKEGLYSIWCT